MHTPIPRSGRGRRPAAEVRAAAVSAAGRLLFAEGIRAITFERIAAEAGVSKTTLYKWWTSPGALAAEAYFTRSEPVLAFPDTGDLHADLVAQVGAFVDLMADEVAGGVLAQLIGAAQNDPAVAEAWTRTYALPRRDLARDRLREAQRAGQLSADADIDIVIDQIWGAFYHRLLVLRTPIRELNVERLVAAAIRGAG